MLYKEYMKVRGSETIKKLEKENSEIGELIGQAKEDFSDIFKIFFKLTNRLHSRRKVLDITLTPDSEDKLALHTFGLYVKQRYMQRSKPIIVSELIGFLRENTEEIIDNVADEIPYKHKRAIFRQYCKMVKKFLDEHNINKETRERKEIEINMLCKKKVYDQNGKINTLKKIVFSETSGWSETHFNVHVIDKNDDEVAEFTINDLKDDIAYLIVFEQLEEEITKGVKQLKQKLKRSMNRIGDEFLKELKDKFSTYLVAEQL